MVLIGTGLLLLIGRRRLERGRTLHTPIGKKKFKGILVPWGRTGGALLMLVSQRSLYSLHHKRRSRRHRSKRVCEIRKPFTEEAA